MSCRDRIQRAERHWRACLLLDYRIEITVVAIVVMNIFGNIAVARIVLVFRSGAFGSTSSGWASNLY